VHELGNREQASSNDGDTGAPASLSHGLGGCDDEDARGLGVHAFQDPALRQDFNDMVGEQEVGEQEVGGRTAADFCSKLFKKLLAPLLPTPKSPPPRPTLHRSRKSRKILAATRLAAKPSLVPVAERAQRKLMRELEFVNPQHSAPDAAVTEYIDMYGGDLPEQAIKAIRAATSLGNKKLAKALAAMVEDSGDGGPVSFCSQKVVASVDQCCLP
jgi:hypothetical protein